jgi:hypothetical protein
MQRFMRFLLPSLSILLAYFLVLAWLAMQLDQKFSFIWRLPFWTETISAVLVPIGVAIILRYFWMRAYHDMDTSGSLGFSSTDVKHESVGRPHKVELLGVWLGGVGLACLLRSPSLFGVDGLIAVVGIFFSRRTDESTGMTRFAKSVFPHLNQVPLWIILMLIIAATAAGLPALRVDKQAPTSATEPAIVVQVRCKPGTSYLWKTDFDKHIRPAIEDVIAKGNTFTGLQVIQSTLPWQPFDFMLIYTGKSFATFDKPGVPPHFAVLFQREGTVRAMAVLNEMNSYEEQSIVTIVYLTKVR